MLLAGINRFVEHEGVLAAQWPYVPPEAVSWMLTGLESLADDVTAAIVREVPEYRWADGDTYGLLVCRLARDALRLFAERFAGASGPACLSCSYPATRRPREPSTA